MESAERLRILRDRRVVIATPDVLHAGLVPNVRTAEIWDFLGQLRLLVVDEVHVYSGVLGSNAAFLFRRLEHLAHLVLVSTEKGATVFIEKGARARLEPVS